MGDQQGCLQGEAAKPPRPQRRDRRYPIAVLWDAYRADGWRDLEDDPFAWISKDDLDAALLRCPYPRAIKYAGTVSGQRPSSSNYLLDGVENAEHTEVVLTAECRSI